MSNKKEFASVSEMARALSDEAFADALDNRIDGRALTKLLVALRNEKGLTQTEVAVKLRVTQGAISKLEHSEDASLTLGEVESYLNALGLELEVAVQPSNWTVVDEVKHLAFSMQRQFDYLVELSKGDDKLEQGVRNFWGEAFVNVVNILAKCGQPLMRKPRQSATRGAIAIQRKGCEARVHIDSADTGAVPALQ